MLYFNWNFDTMNMRVRENFPSTRTRTFALPTPEGRNSSANEFSEGEKRAEKRKFEKNKAATRINEQSERGDIRRGFYKTNRKFVLT